jgi:hypothetical protein
MTNIISLTWRIFEVWNSKIGEMVTITNKVRFADDTAIIAKTEE